MSARRRRVPPILQLDAAECGAACLAMVLAYHGRWEPLDRVRTACDVNRDGSKASNVLKAAAGFGLAGHGLSREPAELAALPLPAILHWNFNHFVVLEAIGSDHVDIVDPAAGRARVTRAALDAAFTGVVLTFAPDAAFQPGGARPQPFADLLALLAPARPALALVALFSVLLVVPGLIVPGLAKLFVDHVLLRQLTDWVVPICAAMVAASVFQVAVMLGQQFCLARVEAALGVTLSHRVMTRLLARGMPFFAQRHAGEVAGRIGIADGIARLLSGQVATTVFNLIAVAFYGVTMLLFDPVVALAAFVVPLAGFAVMRLCHVRMRDLNARVAMDQGRLVGRTVALLAGIESIKAATTEHQSFDHWTGQHARLLDATRALAVPNSALALAPAVFGMIGTVAVLGLGGLRVIDGVMPLGSLLAIQLLMAGFIGPLNGLLGLFERIQHAQGDLARLADTLATDVAPVAPIAPIFDPQQLAPLHGHLVLRNIRYGYGRSAPPLIDDVSLTLRPGMRIALVGGSGSGKSTLARLAAGLLEPWSGTVECDGMPRAAIPAATLAAGITYVDQDIFLFEGSVRDNLTLWDDGVADADVIAALRDAQILDEIEQRPGRQDCRVEEGGGNFSGGQRQRIEIARALTANPAVLILDEATAALDPVTEQRIDRALRRRGCACLIVAHRLSTIRDADEIIVLERGRIAERGTHAGLLADGGAYARLIAAEA